jgi:hypothetical protein
MFGPALGGADDDPRRLLAWYPLGRAARRLFPEAFADLDAAKGSSFPFTADDLGAAHARCTTDWLAWEAAHEAEFRNRAAAVEEEVVRQSRGDPAVLRARLASVEQEKLDRYQRRYAEYIQTAKALAALQQQDRDAASLTR